MEQEVLQEVQDFLADFAGVPLCLFKWQSLETRRNVDFVDPELNLAGYSWSYNPSFFRLLRETSSIKQDINDLFTKLFLRTAYNVRTKRSFGAIVANKDDHWCFCAVITKLIREKNKYKRQPEYLLLGGPLHKEKPEEMGSWRLFEKELKYVEEKECGLSRAEQLRLASELFELPCRPDRESLELEARNLQYTFNGVVRDIVPIIRKNPPSPLLKPPNLAIVLYELFRHIRNADRYMKYLQHIVDKAKEKAIEVAAIAVGFRNPSTMTGFMALYVPVYEESYTREQLIFIPYEEEVRQMLQASSIEEFGNQLRTWMDLPQGIREMKAFHIPFEEGEQYLQGRVFVWLERLHERRFRLWAESFLLPFLDGAASAWETTKRRVESRVMQTVAHHLDRKYNEFTDAIAAFSLPRGEEDAEGEEGTKGDLKKILAVAQEAIGGKAVIYHQPILYKDPPIARPYAWAPGDYVPREQSLFQFLFSAEWSEFEGDLAPLPVGDPPELVPGSLRKEFEFHRLPLSADAAVRRMQENKWQITDNSKLYTVQKDNGILNIYQNLFNAIFCELRPQMVGFKRVFLPVISGNRALGILEIVLEGGPSDDVTLFELKLPLVIEFSERLGLRVPYRRVVTFLRDLLSVLGKAEISESLEALAERIAFHFSESACSIWTYTSERKRFELRGRVGVAFSDSNLNTGLHLKEAQDTVVYRCYKEENPLHINLEKDPRVRAREELLRAGFKQGLALGIEQGDHWLSVVLWSKSPFRENYYSSDDLTFLRLSAFTALQIIRLQDLLRHQQELLELIMTGLGHELRAPLTSIYANIDRLASVKDPKLAKDLENIAAYALALADMLFYSTRVKKLRKQDGTQMYRLFEDIIYRAINAVQWRARQKRLRIITRFDPKDFPSKIRLTEPQKEWMFSIVFNLLDNALKYTYSNSKQPIVLLGQVEERFVVIRIQNHGIGVVKGEEEVIFERFKRGSNAWRGHPVGSGLGLFLGRRFAEALGGELKLTKQKDPTEFSIYFPLWLFPAPWEVKPHEKGTSDR